ncbi:NAD(P)/FAD-dependent oxidoreductase [Microvirga lotononidis]|uniref:Glycine/D-amino acid oxidase, deaminating n=1 Tax=Microvirga lotononidis TaxID=864069 RepID=I4YU47_9HYPH|nr:FAD-binding oxidoreductase [Microvirga lotononidis]EIM27489.1 glycine/D-amino acid oxidase, deaminating [Microvirga lotononidis]WQO28360.1 FAD-binding oxidoreductase [Microvirga lotononidis]
MTGYGDTYYARTLADASQRHSLAGTVKADVAIVGGGLAGLTAALELARAGRSVVVLESERVGWGASGRNGGFVGPGYATSHANISRMVGSERAEALHRLSIEGVRIVEGNLDGLGMTENKRVYGKMSVLRYHDPESLARQCEMLKRTFDYHVEVMQADAVRAVLRSPKYFQALYDSASFHFHPLNYARSLAKAIEDLNGKIFEGSRVTGCDFDGAEKVVRTERGEVRARDVVLAGGGYTDNLVPRLRRSILPIATYVLLTESAPEKIAQAVLTPMAISDNRRAGDYYRVVDEGTRLLWGGRITTRTTEPRRLAEMMQKTMASTYPQLEGVRVETAWSGLMAYARHLMPLIGKLQPGVWHVFGFGGRGMNTTAIGGRVIAEGILGTSDRYRLYEPFSLAWNGGPFGVAAAQLTYWTYQALDRAKERQAARAA